MGKEYDVIKVTPQVRTADTGGVEKYYRVQYKTRGGVVDSVDVAEDDYTEEKLPSILLKLATKHDKLLKL